MKATRRQLTAEFRAIIRKHFKDKAPADIDEVTRQLVAAVPFVRISPKDKGLFFFHGAVDEADVVTAQDEMLATLMNLPRQSRIEITLSSVTFSIFAATAFIALISSMRDDERRVRVHCVGWVSATALAVAQSADERTIERSAFILARPGSHNRVADEDGMSPDKIAYELTLKPYLDRGASMPAFLECYPPSGNYLAASEAVAQGLFDSITSTQQAETK